MCVRQSFLLLVVGIVCVRHNLLLLVVGVVCVRESEREIERDADADDHSLFVNSGKSFHMGCQFSDFKF